MTSITERLKQIMNPGEAASVGLESMSEDQRNALYQWGVRMFGLGRHTLAAIDEVKYDGRLIVLDDGTRWEVDSIDASVADLWSPGDLVLVADSEMYRLDDTEKVRVTEDFG